jgi:hypothetical protein
MHCQKSFSLLDSGKDITILFWACSTIVDGCALTNRSHDASFKPFTSLPQCGSVKFEMSIKGTQLNQG